MHWCSYPILTIAQYFDPKGSRNLYMVEFVVMADHATAPPPPPEFQKPDDYIAMRCQFCWKWTTQRTPFTHDRAKTCKFFPLVPWYQGSREHPKGFMCLLCVNVPGMQLGVLGQGVGRGRVSKATHCQPFHCLLRCTPRAAGN